jgi:general secretion pathway protein A
MELLPCLKESRNLIDRVSLKCKLDPLREDETKEMINFRLRQAGYKSRDNLFADKAISRIYKYTQGYPRKISMFCHRALRLLVMKNKTVVDAKIVEEIVDSEAKFGLEKENLFHTF